MKNLLVILPLIWTCTTAWGQGVLLGPGDSYTLEFTSLSDLRPASPTEIYVGRLAVFFPNDGFIGGETVQIDRFRDTLSDTPVSSITTLPVPSDPNGITALVLSWPNDQPFWTDRQGFVRATGITGSVRLAGFGVNELINGEVYGANFSVPEPSVSLLLFLGAGCLVVRRLHRKGGKPTTGGHP